MNTIYEPARETPVSDSCDVLVVGGGFGGVSAAVAAARNGKKVILLEKEYQLGGLGTAGLVTIFLPICDGMGRQVSFGLAEELLRLSIEHGCENRYPELWFDPTKTQAERAAGKRFMVQYNASLCAISMEQLLLREGVQILYGTSAVEVSVEDRKIKAVMIENKSGRSAITVSSVVDASGDADICKLSGAKTATYAHGNSLAAWYYWENNEQKSHLQQLGFCDIPDGQNPTRELGPKRFGGLDGKELSEAVQLSHASTLSHLLSLREEHPETMPNTIATIPQVRMTRRIVGCYSQTKAEEFVQYPDSVGLYSNWRKAGPVYELPFRTLYGEEVRNLITAGRCISVADDLWELTRVIPVCCVSGEAAGTAAAMSDDFATLSVEALQAQLQKQGVQLHL